MNVSRVHYIHVVLWSVRHIMFIKFILIPVPDFCLWLHGHQPNIINFNRCYWRLKYWHRISYFKRTTGLNHMTLRNTWRQMNLDTLSYKATCNVLYVHNCTQNMKSHDWKPCSHVPIKSFISYFKVLISSFQSVVVLDQRYFVSQTGH